MSLFFAMPSGNTSDPTKVAAETFKSSLSTLMSHTVRAIQNRFFGDKIHLEVVIAVMTPQQIRLSTTTPSLVQIRHFRHFGEEHYFQATVFIHAYATRDLARYVIAHELYHVYLELKNFVAGGKQQWPQVHIDRNVEDECNQFASDFCRSWDKCIREEKAREKLFYFHPHTFDTVVTINLKHQG